MQISKLRETHLAQLSLDVEEAPLFPGIHKHEAVGVGSQALMLLHLLQFLSPAQGERRQSISSLTASLPVLKPSESLPTSLHSIKLSVITTANFEHLSK
jgi:hypothetical protein